MTVPRSCDEIGVRELVIYDPEVDDDPDRATWQVFRRRTPRGPLEQVQRTNSPTVRSVELGCWLRVVGVHGARRLRIAEDAEGEHLYLTEAEALAALKTENEHLRAELAKAKRSPRRR